VTPVIAKRGISRGLDNLGPVKELLPWLVFGLIAAFCLTRLAFLYRRLPAIWHGSAELPRTHSRLLDVMPRSYLTFLLCDTAFLGGVVLVALAVAVPLHSRAVAYAGFGVMLVWYPLMLLHWQVNAGVRPQFLVPPSRRGEAGTWAERSTRRQRRRQGLPPTEHLVEIQWLPDGLMAICTADGCDWLEFPAEDALRPEQDLREQIAEHTSTAPAAMV
jgi:hypothetical protein